MGQVRCKISKSVSCPGKLPWVNRLVTRLLYYSVRFLCPYFPEVLIVHELLRKCGVLI